MSTDRIEVYRTTVRRKWRWRYVAANGNILADSGQGYARRIDCLKALRHVVGGEWVEVVGDKVVTLRGQSALLPETAQGAHAFIVRGHRVIRVEVLS